MTVYLRSIMYNMQRFYCYFRNTVCRLSGSWECLVSWRVLGLLRLSSLQLDICMSPPPPLCLLPAVSPHDAPFHCKDIFRKKEEKTGKKKCKKSRSVNSSFCLSIKKLSLFPMFRFWEVYEQIPHWQTSFEVRWTHAAVRAAALDPGSVLKKFPLRIVSLQAQHLLFLVRNLLASTGLLFFPQTLTML